MKKIKTLTVDCNGTIGEYCFDENILEDGIHTGIETICRVGFDDSFAVLLGGKGNQEEKETPINMVATLWLQSHGIRKIVFGNVFLVGMIPKDNKLCDYPEEVDHQLPPLRDEEVTDRLTIISCLCPKDFIGTLIEAVNYIIEDNDKN